jgi:D-alanyl-D-alanine carboxypeptidase/D-alanyl-D-alanine-endopeptidase (penicillin-binding protein 4)
MPRCSAAATAPSTRPGTFSGVSTLAGYADTSKHGRVRFVIALTSNDGAMRFRLLKAIRSEL